MNFLNLLVALIGLSINPVSALCFRSGVKWEDRAAARQYALAACKGDNAVFDRRFEGCKPVKKCIQHSPTQKIEFMIENNEIFMEWDLNPDSCVKWLYHQIDSCSRGGSSDKGPWTFRADPNKGTC